MQVHTQLRCEICLLVIVCLYVPTLILIGHQIFWFLSCAATWRVHISFHGDSLTFIYSLKVDVTHEAVCTNGKTHYYLKKQGLILGKLVEITINRWAEYDSSTLCHLTAWKESQGAWETSYTFPTRIESCTIINYHVSRNIVSLFKYELWQMTTIEAEREVQELEFFEKKKLPLKS